MGDATLYIVLPTHTADAGIALSAVGIILGVNRAIRVFINGPAGIVYDRLPRRRLFVPSLFIGALSTAVYATTRGFWPLLIGRLLWGLAWSGIWVGGSTIIMDVTTDQNRGRWTGLYQTWFFLGAALGAFLGGLLTDRVGYTTTMWAGAALTAFGGIVALFLLPETRSTRQDEEIISLPSRAVQPSHRTLKLPPRGQPMQQPVVSGKGFRPQSAPGTEAGSIGKLELNNPGLRNSPVFSVPSGLWAAASLQGINRFIISGVLYATMGLLVQERLDTAGLAIGVATLTGALAATRTPFSMAAAPLAGTLSDWLGSRWRVLVWALALGAISLTLVAWSVPVAILVGIPLGAVSSSSIQSLTIALVGDLADRAQQGRAIGLLHTVGDLGSAAGPPVAYALLPGMGLSGIYALCAGLFAVGLGLVLWFLRSTYHVQEVTND
ncbi:MAG: MFS transporter [Chloroflexi bacterium]|nr:MFS transporter [Chloroflexota bacterium]